MPDRFSAIEQKRPIRRVAHLAQLLREAQAIVPKQHVDKRRRGGSLGTRNRTNMRLLVSVFLIALAACAQSGPRIRGPRTVDNFCGEKSPKVTAMESVVSSIADAPATFPVPSAATIRENTKLSGGVIGHWDDLQLPLPQTAKRYGITDQWVHVRDVAITNRTAGVEGRRVYLTIDTPHGPVTFAAQAYDVQDVCDKGQSVSSAPQEQEPLA